MGPTSGSVSVDIRDQLIFSNDQIAPRQRSVNLIILPCCQLPWNRMHRLLRLATTDRQVATVEPLTKPF